MEKRAKKCQELVNTLQSISNEYCLNFANTMQHEVFEVSYKLYCDTVKQYKNSNGNLSAKTPQQPQTPQPEAPAADTTANTANA